MSTSEKSKAKIRGVIDPRRAERFLCDLANRYPINELLASEVKRRSPDHALLTKPAERIKRLYPEMAQPFGDDFPLWVEALYWTQILLRRAWTAQDDRRRNWYLYEMRRQYRDAVIHSRLRTTRTGVSEPFFFSELPGPGANLSRVDRSLIDPPETTPFELAAFHFQDRIGQRAKYCAYAECPTPYFIAPPAKARKYCSEQCSHSQDSINKNASYRRKKERRRVQK